MAPKTKTSEKPTKTERKLFLYSPTKVRSALNAVRNGSMSVLQASNTFKVPRTSLRRKLSGESTELVGKTGPTPELGFENEEKLRDWILENARCGFPINKVTLFDSVEQIVRESGIKTNFSGCRPGRKWFSGFMKRHKEISYKHSEYIHKVRLDVTEEKIRKWFEEVASLLGNNVSVLDDPNRVFNTDETSFSLTPKGDLVLVPRGNSVFYDVSENSDKTNITTLITVNAAGLMAPPFTVYKFQRLPQRIVKQAPQGWGIGTTESGWMTGQAFFEYVANVFNDWLNANKIERPVILFLDGHRSHMTLHLSNFCRDNKIIVVALCPNATHILQPLDVAVFRSLKMHWKSLLRQWRYENNGAEVTKNNITLALDKLLRTVKVKEAIISGFRKCGLCPFDASAVDYNKCKPTERESVLKEVTRTHISHRHYLESKIQPHILAEFQKAEAKGIDYEGDVTACMLFDVWKEFVADEAKENSTNFLHSDSRLSPRPDMEKSTLPSQSTPVKYTTDKEEVSTQPISTPDISAGPSRALSTTPTEEIPSSYGPSTPTHSASIFGNTTPKPLPVKSLDEVFTAVLRYPRENLNTGSKRSRQKDYIPSVVTSDKWVQYYEVKEKEKLDKEKEKDERKQKRDLARNIREEKKMNVTTKKRIRKPDLPTENSSDTESSMNELSESDNEEEHTLDVGVGDYVIVFYENTYFPGVIGLVDEKNGQFQVSTMEKSGPTGWKWPEKDDLLWYPEDDILEAIRPPTVTNSRGVCEVPELAKYIKLSK